MSILDWLPWRRSDRRSLTAAQFRDLGMLDSPTAAGITVTAKTALTLPAYWAGVSLISNAIAKLPRKVYRKADDDAREEVPRHQVAWILGDEPNEFSTPLVFWRTLMAHVLTWGNGYAEIERDGSYRPIALLTLTPDRIEPVVEAGELFYIYDGRIKIPSFDMIHVPGLGFDGIKGYSVVEYARQSLGLGLAAERYGASFFGNGAMPGTVLEHPGTLKPDTAARIRASWNALHQGPDKAHRTAVLEEGMKAKPLSIPAKDAQLIETRQLQALDVCRILNLNPTFIGHQVAERPGGNYEASRLDFLDNTLDPWLVAIEQECNRKLLSMQQRGSYYVEHVRNAILRTDAKSRADVQKVYVDMGAMSPEYVAKIENLPKPEPKPAPAPTPAADPDPEPDPAAPQRQRDAWRRVARNVLAHLTKIEAERAQHAATKGPAKFSAWVEEFYPEQSIRLREALEPVVRGWAECSGKAGWERRLNEVVAGIVQESREGLLAAKATALEADVAARVGHWMQERPTEIAARIVED